MQRPKSTIGLLGGTFDPIHCGHLRMALELYAELKLSKVHIIPCYQPVHRPEPIASAEKRLDMIKCAIQNEPSLYLDTREIDRKGPSYFIDTLMELRHDFPDTSLCLLLGLDSFLGFTYWHRYTEILNYCHIIIAHRPQFQLPDYGLIAELLYKQLQNDISFIHDHLAGGILLSPITPLDISASQIRKQFANGCNPRYLLPDVVYNYIKQNNLYLD